MIDDSGDKRSMVIPKWLPFKMVSTSNELIIPQSKPFLLNSVTKNRLENDYVDFKTNPSSLKASDLMGSALVINQISIAREMAKYVLEKSHLGKPTIDLATRILESKDDEIKEKRIDYRIAKGKHFLSEYPKNPIAWVDIARLYTIKGQNEKAKRSVKIALSLAPIDRFTVRSSIRFFIHTGEFDSAWYYIRRALKNSKDPMIKALEVSIADKMSKSVGRLDKSIPRDLSYNELFHFSELLESYGMLELNSGNSKKAKNSFKRAWINPTENVITHGEWVIRNKLQGLKEHTKLNFSRSPEAFAWYNFFNLNLDVALEKAKEWELQEPYSAGPYILASHIYAHIDKFSESINSAKAGLLANPNHFILMNNLSYALINNGRLKEAERIMNLQSQKKENKEILFSEATRGLLEYKKGNIKIGRKLYFESIKICDELKDDRLKIQALLNMAIAELQAKTDDSIEFCDDILTKSENLPHPTTKLIRERLLKIYKISN